MEKLKALQSDMKVVVGNRKKMDSLEEIITRFVEKDKTKSNYPYYENNLSTNAMSRSNTNNNFNSMNYNKTNFNLNSLDPFNNNGNSSIVIPERDMNRTNYDGSSNTIPRWYTNLKAKKNWKSKKS